MFECNDNNLLLILGIGIIVLLLLKIMCSNNNTIQKYYKNLNEEDNYESFSHEPRYKKSYNEINEPVKEPIIKEPFAPNPNPNPNPNSNSNPNPNPVEQSEKQVQQTSELVSIKIPIINNDIFNPKNIEFDYGDANNVNYTLNVKDNPMDVKKQEDKLTSSDLLPGKSDHKWFENPDVGIKIEDANLLSDAVQKVGVDTVGQTRKNPSYDIRGTVPCPKFQISPWNNSTTEPDYNLKSLY